MSFGPYAKTKDSGYPWLGEIPAHWDMRRLKRMCDINPSKRDIGNLDSQTLVSFLPMELIGDDGSVQLVDTRVVEEVQKGYTYFQDGDVLVAKITPCFENGKGALVQGLVNGIGFGTTELHVLRPRDSLDPRFLWYITASYGFRHTGTAMMVGAAGQKRVPERFVKDFPIAIPPKEEQKTIVRFLDGSLKSISDALAKSRRMIELLHNYRQALITQAVTRGLDPNVPMKDSGIPWLGQIPEHWSVKKIAWRFRRIGSGTTPTSANGDYYDGDIPWVNTGELRDAIVTDTAKKITRRAMMDHSALKLYPKGSLVLALYGATIGKLGILGIDATVNQACCVMTDPVETDVRFAFYWFLGIRQHLLSMGLGGGQANISQEIVRQLRMPAPRVDEQQSIVQYLDAEVGKIDRLVGAYQEEIDHLNEYRQALITAAVTGKIDVRQEVQEHAG